MKKIYFLIKNEVLLFFFSITISLYAYFYLEKTFLHGRIININYLEGDLRYEKIC